MPVHIGNFGAGLQLHSPQVGVAKTPDLPYEPLEKLDLSEADFGPTIKSNNAPSLADELKLAEMDLAGDGGVVVSAFTNGHVHGPEGERVKDKPMQHFPDASPDEGVDINMQNGSSVEVTGHPEPVVQRPEVVPTTSEDTMKGFSSGISPVSGHMTSDPAQGPRPDLIPSDATSNGTEASLAACHDTRPGGHHHHLAAAAPQGQAPFNTVVIQPPTSSFNQEPGSINSHVPSVEIPGRCHSNLTSKDNLLSDVSQPSTISSVASSMSSTVSPKHAMNIGGKDETQPETHHQPEVDESESNPPELDQVDSGISLHTTQAVDVVSAPSQAEGKELEVKASEAQPQEEVSGAQLPASTVVKPVGFGDPEEDDFTEENIDAELEAYLTGMEISSNVHRGAQPDVSEVILSAEKQQPDAQAPTQAQSNAVAKTVPKTLNLTEINKPSVAVDLNLSRSGSEGRKPVSSEPQAESHAGKEREGSAERRQSSDSVEKFLAQSIMSPGISTPMEDAGFSRVPGYTPVESMATLAEELEDPPEALRIALEGEKNRNHSTEGAGTVPSSQPIAMNKPQNEAEAIDSLTLETPSQDLAKSPTGGARPKDPSQMSRKSRPNSLLGLSTPDMSIHRPIVVSPEDTVMETGPIPDVPAPAPEVRPEVGESPPQFAHSRPLPKQRDNLTLDIKNQFEPSQLNLKKVDNLESDPPERAGLMSPEQHMESVYAGHTPHQPHPPPYQPPQSLMLPPPSQGQAGADPSGPPLEGDVQAASKRPTSLSLLPRGEAPPPRPALPDDAYQGPIMDSDSSGERQVTCRGISFGSGPHDHPKKNFIPDRPAKTQESWFLFQARLSNIPHTNGELLKFEERFFVFTLVEKKTRSQFGKQRISMAFPVNSLSLVSVELTEQFHSIASEFFDNDWCQKSFPQFQFHLGNTLDPAKHVTFLWQL